MGKELLHLSDRPVTPGIHGLCIILMIPTELTYNIA